MRWDFHQSANLDSIPAVTRMNQWRRQKGHPGESVTSDYTRRYVRAFITRPYTTLKGPEKKKKKQAPSRDNSFVFVAP